MALCMALVAAEGVLDIYYLFRKLLLFGMDCFYFTFYFFYFMWEENIIRAL